MWFCCRRPNPPVSPSREDSTSYGLPTQHPVFGNLAKRRKPGCRCGGQCRSKWLYNLWTLCACLMVWLPPNVHPDEPEGLPNKVVSQGLCRTSNGHAHQTGSKEARQSAGRHTSSHRHNDAQLGKLHWSQTGTRWHMLVLAELVSVRPARHDQPHRLYLFHTAGGAASPSTASRDPPCMSSAMTTAGERAWPAEAEHERL